VSDRSSLEQPARGRPSIRPSYDPERFGRASEGVARFLGSWRFIAWMTAMIAAWLIYNVVVVRPVDPYPFIFLTLLLSLQASYAAPLILLAQNRQDDRDRVQFQEDRERTERLIADTEYLAREIASLRIGLGEVVTRDYLRRELRALMDEIDDDDE
jgi:uncharacterized membrane protein